MLVLITGSRDWDDEARVIQAVGEIDRRAGRGTLLHGDARGADRIAAEAARCLGWELEAVPAQWDLYGRSAGPRRNAEMVARKPDICLAFIKNHSVGASHCADLAEKSGVMVIRYS